MAGATNNQHFVPQVYLKAWETGVSSLSEPDKIFNGVYAFSDNEQIGNGVSRKSVFWKRNLYTVGFDQLFIVDRCPKIRADFVNKIFSVLRERSPQSVYGKYGHSIIKTKNSIRKHLFTIDEWEFYYDDGNVARKTGILNDIHNLNSYLIENGLDSLFETKWEAILSQFLREMKNPASARIGQSERHISASTANNVLSFFFMLYCRSPRFDGMGIYTWLGEELLKPVFGEASENLMSGIWHTELYSMLYKGTGGHFHSILEGMTNKCQMILYEAYDDSGSFITSDNPAFQSKSSILEIQNMNGFAFPVSPKYLIFIVRGSAGCNVVDYRLADRYAVQAFNRMTMRNRTNTVIANRNRLEF